MGSIGVLRHLATGDESREVAGVVTVSCPARWRLPRNALVAALLDVLHGSLRSFGTTGARDFLAEWRQRDCLAGHLVVVTRGQESFTGLACGLADDGSLLVDRDGSIVPVVAGDVTLRGPG